MATENILGLDNDVKDEIRLQDKPQYKLLSMTGKYVLVPDDVVMRWPILSSYFLSDRWTVDKEGFQTCRSLKELVTFVSEEANKGVSIREEFGGEVAVVKPKPDIGTKPEDKSGLLRRDIVLRNDGNNGTSFSVFNRSVWIVPRRSKNVIRDAWIFYTGDDSWNKFDMDHKIKIILKGFVANQTFRRYVIDNGPARSDLIYFPDHFLY